MDILNFLLGEPVQPTYPFAYLAYREGKYTPSEERPALHIQGARKWWIPWKRHPGKTLYGMSEAMAFRAQDAALLHPQV